MHSVQGCQGAVLLMGKGEKLRGPKKIQKVQGLKSDTCSDKAFHEYTVIISINK